MSTGDSKEYEDYVRYTNSRYDSSATGGYATTYYTPAFNTSSNYTIPPKPLKLHEIYDMEMPEELL